MLPYGKKPKTLPVVLSVEEVAQLLATARPGRERILLTTAYACGLRISELLSLQVTDIDSARMVVNVRQGKGAKDRQVPLSARLLGELRQWWCRHRTKPWLFPGMTGASRQRPMNVTHVQRTVKQIVTRAKLRKKASMHTLRHSYATRTFFGSGCGRGDAAKLLRDTATCRRRAVSAFESSLSGTASGPAGAADGGEGGAG